MIHVTTKENSENSLHVINLPSYVCEKPLPTHINGPVL